jgi:hypothetical protein
MRRFVRVVACCAGAVFLSSAIAVDALSQETVAPAAQAAPAVATTRPAVTAKPAVAVVAPGAHVAASTAPVVAQAVPPAAQTPPAAPAPAEAAPGQTGDRTPPPYPDSPRAPNRARQPRPAEAVERPRGDPEIRNYVSKGVNIRIDATVTESRGDQVLGKKVVSITVLDGDNGSVRSSALVPQPAPANVPTGAPAGVTRVPLNMDAFVWLRDANRVRARVTLDYNRGSIEIGDPGTQRALDSGIRQSVSVMLDDGKPLVVAQSADPEGDRRVTLELKATILK